MKLIFGQRLTHSQRQHVLAVFVHRWTHENATKTYGGRCPGCVQHRQCGGHATLNGVLWHEYHRPLISDDQWIAEHAFYIRDDGQLANRPAHCEPVAMAS